MSEDLQLQEGGLAALSALVNRLYMAREFGQVFQGKRDYYHILGYPNTLDVGKYRGKYDRDPIASRVVDLPAQDTWRNPPPVTDGDRDDTSFVQAWEALVDRRKMWHYLERVDRLAGIGRYGVLLIGFKDGKKLSEPVEPGSLSDVSDVLYFSAFSEAAAVIASYDEDVQSERYGLPQSYTVNMGKGRSSETVHWTRVIHVAEDLLDSEVLGRPRMQRVYNLLEDLIKVVGGGAEATWKLMRKGFLLTNKDDFEFDESDSGKKAINDQIDEFDHGLRRFLRLTGVEAQDLGSDVVDPSGLFGIIVSLCASGSGIPQRILIGSERGELASSQDQATWAGAIASRQAKFAEPVILRGLIDRLVWAGVLPAPSSGGYDVGTLEPDGTRSWPSIFELSDLDKAKVANTYASAISKVAPPGAPDLVIRPGEFRERFLGLPPEVEGEEDEVPLVEESPEVQAFFRAFRGDGDLTIPSER